MIEFVSQPWPWYVSGLVISGIMLLLIFCGKTFGFSSNFRTMCSALGLGKRIPFFDYDWKSETWNLLFAAGALLGGYIAKKFFSAEEAPQLSEAALQDLHSLGLSNPSQFLPQEIFSWEFLFTWRGFIVLVVGGFLVGLGTRWAGGCTSGHAITGLSQLQWPSLLAVIGFFAGGLIASWFIIPFIFP